MMRTAVLLSLSLAALAPWSAAGGPGGTPSQSFEECTGPMELGREGTRVQVCQMAASRAFVDAAELADRKEKTKDPAEKAALEAQIKELARTAQLCADVIAATAVQIKDRLQSGEGAKEQRQKDMMVLGLIDDVNNSIAEEGRPFGVGPAQTAPTSTERRPDSTQQTPAAPLQEAKVRAATKDGEMEEVEIDPPEEPVEPGSAAAYRMAGGIYEHSGAPARAAQAYQNALSKKEDAGTYALLARARLATGEREAATEAARRALSLDPSQRLAKLVLGHADQLTSGAGKARLFGGGFGAKPQAGALDGAPGRFAAGSPQAGGLAGAPGAHCASTAGPAGQAAGPGRPNGPGSAPAPSGTLSPLVRKALVKARLGDRGEALLLLSQAIDADPNEIVAWLLRAELQNEAKDYAAAEADATRTLQLNPEPATAARALRARAFAELQEGKDQAALADAWRAVELDPSNGLGFLYKGMAEQRTGHKAAALADLRRAIALDPTLRATAAPLFAALGEPLDGAGATAQGDARPAADSLRPKLLRGGLIAGSLLLVLLGILGLGGRSGRATAPPAAAPENEETAAAPGELAPGTVVGGGYRIERELGRGGMGVVYEALDETLRRRVALKRMQGGSPEDMERFLREARLVAQLKHPRIAEIHNVIMEREPILVFELVEGAPLDRVLRERGRLPPHEARRVVSEVCEALGYAHARNIIHRDLKPSNVMLGPRGDCKVMDFGIAHESRGGATSTLTAPSGTPAYMPPEQGMGSVSRASDLYALGVMAYELLTGSRPFDGPDYLEPKLNERWDLASSRNPALPPQVDAFFAKALAADPKRRFAGAGELCAALDAALASTAPKSA